MSKRSKDLRSPSITPEEANEELGLTPKKIADAGCELPIGVVIDSKVVKTAQVRSITGADRKAASSGDAQKSPAHMTTTLLFRCVTDLGGKPPSIQDIRRMYEPDRMYLAAEIRRKTYPGEPMLVTAECDPRAGGCGAKWDFEIDLDNIDVRYVDDPLWRDNQACFEVIDEEMNLTAVFHYLRGMDSETLADEFKGKKIQEISPAELLDAHVLATLININDKKVSRELYDALGAQVHSTLEEGIQEHRAGPDLENMARCKDCGKSMDPQVNIVDFLLRGRAPKASRR